MSYGRQRLRHVVTQTLLLDLVVLVLNLGKELVLLSSLFSELELLG